MGEHPEQGWKTSGGLHPIQQAFVETGSIQCGYCTPAQVLAASAELLAGQEHPNEAEVRDALSGKCYAVARVTLASAGSIASRGGAARRASRADRGRSAGYTGAT